MVSEALIALASFVFGLATTMVVVVWKISWISFKTDQLWREREQNWKDCDKINTKLNTIWSFILRRGQVEGISNELFDMNSPIKLRPKAFYLFNQANLTEALRDWYATEGVSHLSDIDLTLAIEDKFGQQLMKDVCSKITPPLVLSSCVLIAAAIAKGAKEDQEVEITV